MSISEIYLVGFMRAIHQYYVHSNLDWGHGPLRHVIASPRFHRWHHADVEEAYDKNFALAFPIWDHLFGTYYCPGSSRNVPTGFDGNPGDDFMKLFFYPFKQWGAMWRNRKGSVSAASHSTIEAAE